MDPHLLLLCLFHGHTSLSAKLHVTTYVIVEQDKYPK